MLFSKVATRNDDDALNKDVNLRGISTIFASS